MTSMVMKVLANGIKHTKKIVEAVVNSVDEPMEPTTPTNDVNEEKVSEASSTPTKPPPEPPRMPDPVVPAESPAKVKLAEPKREKPRFVYCLYFKQKLKTSLL